MWFWSSLMYVWSSLRRHFFLLRYPWSNLFDQLCLLDLYVRQKRLSQKLWVDETGLKSLMLNISKLFGAVEVVSAGINQELWVLSPLSLQKILLAIFASKMAPSKCRLWLKIRSSQIWNFANSWMSSISVTSIAERLLKSVLESGTFVLSFYLFRIVVLYVFAEFQIFLWLEQLLWKC